MVAAPDRRAVRQGNRAALEANELDLQQIIGCGRNGLLWMHHAVDPLPERPEKQEAARMPGACLERQPPAETHMTLWMLWMLMVFVVWRSRWSDIGDVGG